MPADLVKALHAKRLSGDTMSYPQLASAIGIRRETLHRLMTKPGVRTTDRMLVKIRRYLEASNEAVA